MTLCMEQSFTLIFVTLQKDSLGPLIMHLSLVVMSKCHTSESIKKKSTAQFMKLSLTWLGATTGSIVHCV